MGLSSKQLYWQTLALNLHKEGFLLIGCIHCGTLAKMPMRSNGAAQFSLIALDYFTECCPTPFWVFMGEETVYTNEKYYIPEIPKEAPKISSWLDMLRDENRIQYILLGELTRDDS
jgi:hypothetical protein